MCGCDVVHAKKIPRYILMEQLEREDSVTLKKSNRWRRIWKRWRRKGVVEVDINHHRYKLLDCIRQGVQDLHKNHPDLGPKETFDVSSLQDIVVKEIVSTKGRRLTFKSYASSVFASIRQAVGVTENSYLNAVAPDHLPYLEFISNSKSGQHFYLSNDQQFILKTDKKYSIDFFLTFLGEYLQHFQNYPHSLIVKFLGLYSIEGAGQPKKYFLSMQNVFFPPERIENRYDIKGCLGGRYQKPPSTDHSEVITILKDKNFQNLKIDLGFQRDWFLRQLEIDVGFFCELGVQDYSLLVGNHPTTKDAIKPSFGSIVLRMRKSFPNKTKSVEERAALPPLRIPGRNRVFQSEEGSTTVSQYLQSEKLHNTFSANQNSMPNSGSVIQKTRRENSLENSLELTYSQEVSSFGSLVHSRSGLDSITHNQRLLLNCKNPLHVIDGPKQRYYLGIIDFFTKYECKQRCARILKTIKLCTSDHSTVPPERYASRFLNFVTDRTLGFSKAKSDL